MKFADQWMELEKKEKGQREIHRKTIASRLEAGWDRSR